MNCPTKEQILEASKTSKEAKQALQKLFPEVFEDEKYFDLSKLLSSKNTLFSSEKAIKAGFRSNTFMDVRSSLSKYYGKAFYLNDDYNWELKRDNRDVLCLIPTKK